MDRKSRRATSLLAGIIAAGLVGITAAAIYQMRAPSNAAASSDSLTLNPDMFEGETRAAYLIAQKHPDLLAQLDCYCGCEQHEGHKNLLDCFRSNHGATCATCTGEAVTAGQLFENGTPVEQIRAILRQRYPNEG
jgi:hypothetical protein